MTTIIKAKELIIKGAENILELPENLKEQVSIYWNEQKMQHPGMFNGPVYSVLDM